MRNLLHICATWVIILSGVAVEMWIAGATDHWVTWLFCGFLSVMLLVVGVKQTENILRRDK